MTAPDQRHAHPRVHPVGGRGLVLDVRELGRRAGTMSRVDLVVPAPDQLASIGSQVPAGDDVHLELRLESVLEGVLVSGTADAAYTGECSRCLEPVTGAVTAAITELFAYPRTDARGRVVPRPAGDPFEQEPVVQGDTVDLEPTVRDSLVLALPVAPLCRASCPGLCPQCGFELVADPDHHHDQVDPRWAALVQLLGTPDGPKEEG